MRPLTRLLTLVLVSIAASCGTDVPTACCDTGTPSLRIVNAFNGPVDVLVDGSVAIQSLAAGVIDTVAPSAGAHSVVLRSASAGSSTPQSVTTVAGALRTLAAVRASTGALSTAALDDTNSVVPAGATKVRVLHLAPSAGTIQVYRTQPDYQVKPVSWQFPFNYQPTPTSLSAPFYQSTVGTWDVRAWQTPADSSGWATAPVKVLLPLTSGEKRTIMILDKAGGGIRVEVL